MDDDRLQKALREAQMLSENRLSRLIGEGPEGLAPELWNVLLDEKRRRGAALVPGAALGTGVHRRYGLSRHQAVLDSIGYTDYDDVPLFRRSTVNSELALLGLVFPPAMACVAGTLLTGDIYYDKVGPDGTLKRWPRSNRAVAYVLLGLQVAALVFRFVILG